MSNTLALVRSYYGDRPSVLASDHAVVSPSAQAELAEAYASLPDEDPLSWRYWSTMADEVIEQHWWLRRHGFTFSVHSSDPYASAADMFADVEENRHIACFSTEETGGHPFFTNDQNDAFRQVHDVLGHFAAQRGFDRHGEEAAFQRHSISFSYWGRIAMATETRGQNAGLIATGDFVSEKIAPLHQRWRLPNALQPRDEAEALAANTHARTFPHFVN